MKNQNRCQTVFKGKNIMKKIYGFLTLLIFISTSAFAAGAGPSVPKNNWAFEGLPTNWDKNQLYRGYTVATQVCMSCHGIKYLTHRDMIDVGFTEAEVKTLASNMEIGINDKLKSALDDETAKELYGKSVPDLSIINRARPGLANYTYALLTGYTENEEEIAKIFPDGIPEGAYYNRYFPGHAIAMSPPLMNGLVDYHDTTDASVEQMAKDVTYFLQWTAEPELIERKKLGVYVLIYLIIFTLLAYLAKNAIWRDVK